MNHFNGDFLQKVDPVLLPHKQGAMQLYQLCVTATYTIHCNKLRILFCNASHSLHPPLSEHFCASYIIKVFR